MILHLALLQVSLVGLPSADAPIRHLETTRAMIVGRQFRQLNERLEADLRLAEGGDRTRLMWSTAAFTAIPGMPFAKWEREFPLSWQPFLAEAYWFFDAAGEARGTKWASETSDAQFAGQREMFGRMREQCRKASSLRARLCPCHTLAIASEEGPGVARAAAAAFEACPTDFGVITAQLSALAPRWGGSYAEMEAAVLAGKSRGVSVQDLARLRNHIRIEKAKDLITAGRGEDAFAVLNEGAVAEPTQSILRYRARRNWARRDPRAALADANESLRHGGGWESPPYALVDLLVTRGWALYQLRRPVEAYADIQAALIISPESAEARKWAKRMRAQPATP
jgi:tetratricopeptide (TPR) repeat protein